MNNGKITIKYSHDHTNDTKIVYFKTKYGSHMECSFTSEDPDYGTETIEYNSEPIISFYAMAKDQLREIEEYLDATENGIKRDGNAPNSEVYDDYINTTLYAVENALRSVVGNGMEQDYGRYGERVMANCELRDRTNIRTGNFMTIPKGTVGSVLKINNRKAWKESHVDVYLVRWNTIIDFQTGDPIETWESTLSLDGMPDEVYNSSGNLIQILTVEEAAKAIKNTVAENINVEFSMGTGLDGRNVEDFVDDDDDMYWYGVKLIPNDSKLFDSCGFYHDYIFMVGYFGGGNVSMAYFCNEFMSLKEWDGEELIEAMCKTLDMKRDEQILLETIKKEDK